MNHGGDLKEKGIEKRRSVVLNWEGGGWVWKRRKRWSSCTVKWEMKGGGYLDSVGLGRRKGAEVVDNLEGEMIRRRSWEAEENVGVTYLALVQDINWHVVRSGGEVIWSSAVTCLLSILLLRQESRPNIKDIRWCCGGCEIVWSCALFLTLMFELFTSEVIVEMTHYITYVVTMCCCTAKEQPGHQRKMSVLYVSAKHRYITVVHFKLINISKVT